MKSMNQCDKLLQYSGIGTEGINGGILTKDKAIIVILY